MEKDLLETFVTLANVQNISKTAQVLYISQAAVSHRLKKLEEHVGEELIIRNKGAKHTHLTAAGTRFLPLAQNWLRLDQDLENFQHRPQTLELTIGTVNSVNNYLFSAFYNQLKTDWTGGCISGLFIQMKYMNRYGSMYWILDFLCGNNGCPISGSGRFIPKP